MEKQAQCPNIHYFGAPYVDAGCIDGFLWDLDSGSEPGQVDSGGEIPCPICNRQSYIDYIKDDMINQETEMDDDGNIILEETELIARATRQADLIYQKYVGEITVGKIISDAIALHELIPAAVEKELHFPKSVILELMNDGIYTNTVPVVLFKNLLISLHIPFAKIESVILPTFKILVSKETSESIKKKPQGYLLWENEESLMKYTNKLKDLMGNTGSQTKC